MCLHGHQFANDEDVKDVMFTWLHAQLKSSFTDGIGKLMVQSNKFVEKLWDYIEK